VILLSVGKTVFTMLILSVVVALLYSVNIYAIGWWLIPFFVCAVMTGWWVGFISAGIVIRHGQKVQTVVWTLPGILLPFSVVFFPLANLPSFLHPISYLLPSTYIFESMRALLYTQTIDPKFIAISFGLNIIYLILSIIWFLKSFKWSLNLGLSRFN
jgi:ABC-2 type transport system permease protein